MKRWKGFKSMKTNEKTSKNSIVRIIVLLILTVTVIALVGFAYARYVTRISGQATAPIAHWSFKVNQATGNQQFTIDLAQTKYTDRSESRKFKLNRARRLWSF